MNTNTKNIIDWSSPNVLNQIAHKIKCPLESIIAANNKGLFFRDNKETEIIFSSSKEISEIVEEIIKAVSSNSVDLSYKQYPDIFQIYDSNKNVQSMCTKSIKPEKISKSEQSWLMNFETEIYSCIKKNNLCLNELADKMAVSERQLHRKIGRLVYLTPNKYVRILRLHKANQIIEKYIYDSVAQIAYAVGYTDTHYFSKQFFIQYNILPQELLPTFKQLPKT